MVQPGLFTGEWMRFNWFYTCCNFIATAPESHTLLKISASLSLVLVYLLIPLCPEISMPFRFHIN